MIDFLLFIGLVVCLVKISSLTEKVDALMRSNKSPALETTKPISTTTNTAVSGPDFDLTPASIKEGNSAESMSAIISDQDFSDRLIAWLKQDFMVKLGAFLLLIGLGWFVSYAFANNWIGPVGRISLGILLGVSFMVVGLTRMEKVRHQGGIFMVLGSGIVLLTVFAAREIYDIFTPTIALLVMFSTVVLIARVAVVYQSKDLATAGFLLAAVAPFLTNSPTTDALPLFLYLSVIVVGSLWILSKINATDLMTLAFFTVVLYTLPYLSSYASALDAAIVLTFGFAFTAIFFLVNTTSIIKWTEEKLSTNNLVVAVGSGLYVAVLINEMIASEWHSLLYIAWALVYAFGVFFVFTQTKNPTPFYLYGLVALGFLGAATVAQFEGPVLTLVLSFEITLLVGFALRLLPNKAIARNLSWLYLVPILLSLENIDSYNRFNHLGDNTILNADSIILFTLALCLGGAAYMMHEHGEKSSASLLAFLSGGYLATLIWLMTHSVMPDVQATYISLMIYTLAGIGLYVDGRINDVAIKRQAGITIIAFVIARLLLVDVWQMEVAGRIITFLSIGALLISTAFIKKLNQTQ